MSKHPLQEQLEGAAPAALAVEKALSEFPARHRAVALVVNLLDLNAADGSPVAPEVLAAALIDTARYLHGVGKRTEWADDDIARRARVLLRTLAE